MPFAVGLIATLAGTDLATVKATLAHPAVAIALMVLIVSMAVHMRIGMQVIIEDYVHGEGAKIAAPAREHVLHARRRRPSRFSPC